MTTTTNPQTVDFTIEQHGLNLVLIRPHSDEAREALEEIVDGDAPWWGNALAVAPAYAEPILIHLTTFGWEVR